MSEEGIRQGDSLSSFFFCTLMDAVAADLLRMLDEMDTQLRHSVQILMYMDDITIVCEPAHASVVTRVLATAMEINGLKPNFSKSSVLMPDVPDTSITNIGLTVCSMNDYFRVLGTSITKNHVPTVELYTGRMDRFFGALQKVRVHPQIVFTMLRICGRLKMLYLATTTPPHVVQPLAERFHNHVSSTLAQIVDSPVPAPMIYDVLGAGMVDYRALCSAIYDDSIVLTMCPRAGAHQVRLSTNSFESASLRSQHDAQWLFYGGSHMVMTPAQFALALAVRFRTLPQSMQLFPLTCGCGTCISTSSDAIEHFIRCDKASTMTKTHRHNAVRNALTTAARSFGVNCQQEPRLYTDLYENGHQRPDITFFTYPPIVTDISVVMPEHDVDVAATRVAKEKVREHEQTVARVGHKFIPFVMESYGHFHAQAHQLIMQVASFLPPHLQRACVMSMTHATSTALAVTRGDAIRLAVLRATRY
jgi:hypothetical protein